MSRLVWQTRFELGIPEIDEQHKRLVALIVRLQDSMDEKATDLGGPVVGEVLRELVEYTQYHFKFEEEHMARTKYAAAAEHHKQHQRLLKDIRATLQRLRDGGDLTQLELIEFLKSWLVNHILTEDKKYGRDLEERIAAAKRAV